MTDFANDFGAFLAQRANNQAASAASSQVAADERKAAYLASITTSMNGLFSHLEQEEPPAPDEDPSDILRQAFSTYN